jgi:hypothetical protein
MILHENGWCYRLVPYYHSMTRYMVVRHPKAVIAKYGLLASGTKAQTIARARELIAAAKPAQTAHKQAPDSAAATDQPPHPCPCCGGRMIIIETFERGSTPRYRPTATPITIRIDTS